ncbi:GDP-mannose 4,6-dehydratase [Paenibacillus sp. JX-17]|uniref:GDP-mannose 4,6-dehydratase n=1 Tax=Paenibacillus lacisoli TaxID=3064525 RepID=A0ABT9CEC7_9BACL|nr:NAD-dependent epimerase/dehydratase family protein [Paenibacillus sp. JX-17]MDO7906984.1 GDP-mannose 4,6-dehydratase [Paenibacillus sp. JX-17]
MDAQHNRQSNVILITGALGFTGIHACRHFADLGWRVAALVRKIPASLPSGLPENMDIYSCDLLDKEKLKRVVKQISPDYVLHLGGKNSVPESWEHPLLYLETNVMSTLYLLDALRPLVHTRVVIVGSRVTLEMRGNYGEIHPYCLSKSLQEQAALQWRELFGQHIVIAEPSNLVGPGPSTGFCALLAHYMVSCDMADSVSQPFHISSRVTKRDFLDVRDAVRAYAVLLQKGDPGSIYPVCSGKQSTLETMAVMMMQQAGRNYTIEYGNQPENTDHPESPPEALNRLGWEPHVTLRESIKDVVTYFRMKGV